MHPMTNNLRMEIKLAIKNRQDISNLIRDVEIKGEDLSYAIIEDFTRIKSNMSRTKFCNSIIGKKGKVTNISDSIMRECNFGDVIFIGTVFMRRCDCTGSDFSGADCRDVQYQNSIMINCKFCETNLRLGTAYGMGAIFDTNFFADLEKGWNVKIVLLEEYNKLIEELNILRDKCNKDNI